MKVHRSTRTCSLVLALAALTACAPDSQTPLSPGSTGPLLTTAIFEKPTKTATGYREQSITYDWTIEKSVSPATAEIATGASATFDYTLTATRTESASSDNIGVRGQICVKNLGSVDSEGMTVVDNVQASTNGGTTWTTIATESVDVSGNPVVSPGETACFDYDVEFTSISGALYRNQGNVTWTNAGNGGAPAPGTLQTWETVWVPFTLPASPTGNITDEGATLSDVLTCPTGFVCTPGTGYDSGTWTLTGSSVITYEVAVLNSTAPCGHTDVVENTATLTEGDSGDRRADDAGVAVTTPDCAPLPNFQGCTPGYWKQTQHFGNWIGYVPTGPGASRYNTVFGVNLFGASTTLLDALTMGGGGMNRFGRHSTAALLNAASSDVSYGMTPAQVIAAVQAAVASGDYDGAADTFEQLNERQCPLGRAS